MKRHERLSNVMNAMVADAISPKPDLWPRIKTRIDARRHRTVTLVRLAAACLVGVVLIGASVFLTGAPRPVSAAEILDRAQSATQTMLASSMKGFSGYLVGKARTPLNSKPPENPDALEWSTWQTHLWVGAADLQRIELYITADQKSRAPRLNNPTMQALALSKYVPTDQRAYSALLRIMVTNGPDQWELHYLDSDPAGPNEILLHGPTPALTIYYPMNYDSLLFAYQDRIAGGLDEATQLQRTRYSRAVRGADDKILDRPVYTVVFNEVRSGVETPFQDEVATAWYDQETYMLLGVRLEVKLKDKLYLWGEWKFAALDLNPALPATTFSLRVPSGIPVVEVSMPPTMVSPTPVAP